MKKSALIGLLAASLSAAGEYRYEIAPVIGYTIANSDQQLRDHTVTGMQMQFNDVDSAFKPQFLFLYSDTDRRDELVGDTDIFRLAVNGVYEFQNNSALTPFVKAGLGYEIMSDHYYANHNSLFANAGAGIKIGLTKQTALTFEVIEMVKYNKASWENNLLYMAGLNYAFGEKEAPALTAQ